VTGVDRQVSDRWRPTSAGCGNRTVQAEGRPLHGRALKKKVGKTGANNADQDEGRPPRADQVPHPEARAGTEARPRLTVFRSVAHMYVQVVDDMTGRTIASASTSSRR